MSSCHGRPGWSGEYCDQEQEDNCEDGVDNDGGEKEIIFVSVFVLIYVFGFGFANMGLTMMKNFKDLLFVVSFLGCM